MNLIELNKFSELHDGEKIIFCKTDFLSSEFHRIRNLKHDVILISGNSDYGIDSTYFNNIPKNIVYWFAQNALHKHEKLIPIPLGLENYKFSKRENHGVGYERAKFKESLILNQKFTSPTKKIYSNFKIETNPSHRRFIKNFCLKSNIIDWEEPNLSLESFFSKLQDYEACVCPAGNGVDTHRLWEVLYFNRIPITVKVGDFKIYELYEKLPIVILENQEQLLDTENLLQKVEEKKNMDYDRNIIKLDYWIDLMKSKVGQ